MATPHPQTKFTYEDYQSFSDVFTHGWRRHELIDGEHFASPTPSTRHQLVYGRLQVALAQHVHCTRAGHLLPALTEVVLSEFDVVQPDLLFISAAKASIITEKNIQGPPDLVIEILSETTRRTDEIIKRKLYERYRVPEYWIVDPELETVKVFRLTDRGYQRTAELTRESGDVLTTPLLPDLQIQLAALFE